MLVGREWENRGTVWASTKRHHPREVECPFSCEQRLAEVLHAQRTCHSFTQRRVSAPSVDLAKACPAHAMFDHRLMLVKNHLVISVRGVSASLGGFSVLIFYCTRSLDLEQLLALARGLPHRHKGLS